MDSFKPHMMDIVAAWCTGVTFAQIIKMTDIFEGSIIRCMRRLEELLREMCNAAKAIGNSDLEKKFGDGKFGDGYSNFTSDLRFVSGVKCAEFL